MAVSLVVFEGPTPSKARPVLATRDPYIIAALRRLLVERLTDEPVTDFFPPGRNRAGVTQKERGNA